MKSPKKLIEAISRATECEWYLNGHLNEWVTLQYNVVSNTKPEILEIILEEYKDYLRAGTIQIYSTVLRDIVVYNRENKTVRHIKKEEDI